MTTNIVRASRNPIAARNALRQQRIEQRLQQELQQRALQDIRSSEDNLPVNRSAEGRAQKIAKFQSRVNETQQQIDTLDAQIAQIRQQTDEARARQLAASDRQERNQFRQQKNRLANREDNLLIQRTRLLNRRADAMQDLRSVEQTGSRRQDESTSTNLTRQRELLGINQNGTVQRGGAIDRAQRASEQQERSRIQRINNVPAPQGAIARNQDGSFTLRDGSRVFPTATNSDGSVQVARVQGGGASLVPRAGFTRDTGFRSPTGRNQTQTIETQEVGTGSFRAAPQNNFIDNVRGAFGQFFNVGETGFGAGSSENLIASVANPSQSNAAFLQSGGNIQRQLVKPGSPRDTGLRLFEGTTYFTGIAGQALTLGGGVRAATATSSFLGRQASRLVPGTSRLARVGQGTANTLTQTGVGFGLIPVVETGADFAATQRERVVRPENIGFIQSEEARAIFGQATQAQQRAANERGTLQGIAQQLPIVPIFTQRTAFDESAREQLRAQGVPEGLVETRLQGIQSLQQNRETGLAFGSIVGIERTSEAIGRPLVAGALNTAARRGTQLNRPFAQLFGITAPRIGVAGAVEGGLQPLFQNALREENASPQELFRQVGAGVAIGAPTAAILGGTVIGLVTRPGARRTLNTALNIADPFELPGDITQDIVEFGQRRLLRQNPPRPKLLVTNVRTPTVGFAPTVTSTQQRSPSSNIVSVRSPSRQVSFREALFSPFTGIPTTSRTPNPVPTPTNNRNPTNSRTSNPASSRQNTPQQQRTTTSVPANTLVSLPTTVIGGVDIPPPIPLELLGDGSGGQGNNRQQSTFVNELAFARNFFRNQFASPIRPQRRNTARSQGPAANIARQSFSQLFAPPRRPRNAR